MSGHVLKPLPASMSANESLATNTQTSTALESTADEDDEFTHLHASRAMKESLRKLQDELRCTLCDNVYREPVTLSCAHSFCKECIDFHGRNSWSCPCKLSSSRCKCLQLDGITSLSFTQQSSFFSFFNALFLADPGCNQAYSIQTTGSYRKFNPTLETLVSSLRANMDTLKRAPPDWWKEGGDIDPPFEEENSDNDRESDVEPEEDGESVDLQQPRNTDQKDDESILSDGSEV